MKVDSQVVHCDVDRPGAIIALRADRRFRPLCHQCGRPTRRVHSDGHRRIVRDLAMTDTEVWLQIHYRKVWCDHCQSARVERLSCCDASRRITHRLARYIYELCKHMPVTTVAKHLQLDPKTVKAVDKMFLERQFGPTVYEGLRVLAIDEIAVKKHQQYMTVVLNYDTGGVVWMGPGRRAATLDAFFGGMTDLQRQAIQAVAMDMWTPYISAVGRHCRQAKIVFDLFHIVKAYGHVIDRVRRQEVRRATGPPNRAIKGSRYLLLRNRENLTEDQQGRLEELLAVNATLNAVYVLKDQLKMIYRYKWRWQAKRALDQWCEAAAAVANPSMGMFIQMLRRHEAGILNHCQFPIGTSRLEGVNNTIKVIKRKAYGFHDTRYFTLKVKQAFPGKNTSN